MAKDRNNVRNWGDDAGGVWVATKGTTGPTGLEPPPSGFAELGWLAEDGVNVGRSFDTEDVTSVGGTLLKKVVTSMDDTITVGCLEETAVTLGLLYRGKQPVVTGEVAKITVADQRVSDERAWIFDFREGTNHKRYVVPDGEVTEIDEIPHAKTSPAMYQFTITLYGDYEIYANTAALTTA